MSNWQKEDYCNSLQWKRPLTGRCAYWEMPFTRFFGDDWISKLKRCKTWTEWLFLTKDFGHAWHSMLNLKYTSDLARVQTILQSTRKDRVMIVIHGMSHGHQTVIFVLILGDSKVVVNWMNGDWEFKGNEHTTQVRDVIDQFVRWYLSGIFDQETMRVLGADMYSGNQTRLLIHMLTG